MTNIMACKGCAYHNPIGICSDGICAMREIVESGEHSACDKFKRKEYVRK